MHSIFKTILFNCYLTSRFLDRNLLVSLLTIGFSDSLSFKLLMLDVEAVGFWFTSKRLINSSTSFSYLKLIADSIAYKSEREVMLKTEGEIWKI